MRKSLFLLAAAAVLLTVSCGEKEETVHLVEDRYQEEPVSVLFEEGELKGSLMWPVEEERGNLVIIVPGSGPTDRNGNNPQAGENNNLLMIAEALSDAGHYSLRYDKRGIGESGDLIQKESDMDFHDSVNDVLAWIAKFKEDPRFDKIILLGHSEGALLSAQACSISSDCDALISVSGTAMKAHVLLLAQLKAQSREAYEMSVPIVEELAKGNMVPEVPVSLFNLFRPSVQPYLISWFSYDPVKIISEITDPVLILHGDRDIQISHQEAQVLHEASEGSQLEIIEGMNHILKDAPEGLEGNIATYSDPDLPLSADFMKKVIEFVSSL